MFQYNNLLNAGPSQINLGNRIHINLPNLSTCTDSRGNHTGAAGYGCTSLIKSLGEYAERFVFFYMIEQDGECPYGEMDKNYMSGIYNMLNNKNIDAHQLHKYIRVYNIYTGACSKIPVNLVNLGNRYKDETLIFQRDTNGCAIQKTYEKSVHTALKEYIERQLLIRFWIENREYSIISNIPSMPIYEYLSKSGEVRVIDLSDDELGIYCYFVVYFGRGNPVWYSSAISADISAYAALCGALNELWQIYSYIYSCSIGEIEVEKITDTYQREYVEYNNVKTKSYFTKCNGTIDYLEHSSHEYSYEKIVENIRHTHTQKMHVYHKEIDIFGEKLHAVRVLSPDYFMHIKLSSAYNNNLFMRKFKTIDHERKNMDLPFP